MTEPSPRQIHFFRRQRRSCELAGRHWPLVTATILLVFLWAGPLARLSQVSFTAHMLLHLGVVLIAAPLLALCLKRSGLLGRAALGLGTAMVFSAVEMLAVWAWHAPVLHAAAALRPGAFAVQQASFLIAGILVWLPGLAGSAEHERGAAAAGALAMGASFTHMSMLGVLLSIAPGIVYAPGLCGGAFGLDPLTDQRAGGALMAVSGGLFYLTAAVLFLRKLLTTDSAAPEVPTGTGIR